ncbi:MAG: hypothetical protein AB7P17_12700, partial [Nitrospirales bacterium]
IGLLLMACTACASGHLTPISLAVDGLVTLEDLCEEPIEDMQTLTSLEATADMLALPMSMAIWTVRLVAYSTVGMGMVLAGKDAKATVDQINWVLPWDLAGPDPDQVRYLPEMVKKEGC